MTIIYDAEMPFYKAMLCWKGTVTRHVSRKPTIWVLMVIHIAFLVAQNVKSDVSTSVSSASILTSYLPVVPWSAVSSFSALVTFFTVFYATQCYSRLQLFWGHCIGIGGTCMNWVGMVRNHLPRDPMLQWNATRLVIGAVHIQYYSLDDGGAPIGEDEWEMMRDRGLFTTEEIDVMKQYKGFKPWVPVLWALQEVEVALGNREGRVLADFRKLAFDLRGFCGQMTNWIKQPVPFAYFHILTILQLVFLTIISYALVTLVFHWALTAALYVIVALAFLGLTDIGIAMADPFGDDDTDFEVEALLTATYNNAIECLKNVRQPYLDKDPILTTTTERAAALHAFLQASSAAKQPMENGHSKTGAGGLYWNGLPNVALKQSAAVSPEQVELETSDVQVRNILREFLLDESP